MINRSSEIGMDVMYSIREINLSQSSSACSYQTWPKTSIRNLIEGCSTCMRLWRNPGEKCKCRIPGHVSSS